MTDVEIVRDSGLLKFVRRGDLLMADRSFLIQSDLDEVGATLVIPALKGMRLQLEGVETENFRIFANVRIHVERMIGNLRKKFTILCGPIKICNMCTDSYDETFVDKIANFCCCLHNAMPSVVFSV